MSNTTADTADTAIPTVTNEHRGEPRLQFKNVSRSFGKRCAVARVSFSVAPGEIVGLAGRNGAGKTTLLRLAAGILEPDSGEILIDGAARRVGEPGTLAPIGYVADGVPLPGDARVREYLRFRAILRGVARAKLLTTVQAAIEKLDLTSVVDRLIAPLSRGFKQRVALAESLLIDPAVLLLDEPTTGLDPLQARSLRHVLTARSGNCATLISSHDLASLAALCDRLVVMEEGRVAGAGTIDELRRASALSESAALDEVFHSVVGKAAS